MARKIYDPWEKKSKWVDRSINKFIGTTYKPPKHKSSEGCMVFIFILIVSIISAFIIL